MIEEKVPSFGDNPHLDLLRARQRVDKQRQRGIHNQCRRMCRCVRHNALKALGFSVVIALGTAAIVGGAILSTNKDFMNAIDPAGKHKRDNDSNWWEDDQNFDNAYHQR